MPSSLSSPSRIVPSARKRKKPVRAWETTVRYTEAEKELITVLKGDMSYSSYIRKASLGHRLPALIPEVNYKTYAELARIGSNLNQLVRQNHIALKEGKAPIINGQAVSELRQVIEQLALQLIGADLSEDEGADDQ